MAFTALLPHQVEVFRRSGRKDRLGQPTGVNPRAAEDDSSVGKFACRAYQKSGGLLMEERMTDTFVRRWRLYTDLAADIREDDAVLVTDPRTGHVLYGKAKVYSGEVVYDARGPHHQEFEVWDMSGPNRG